MSTLEIILYIILGVGTIGYCSYVIVKWVLIKKGKWKFKTKKGEEEDD